MRDDAILVALRDRSLLPHDVGLDYIEVRTYGDREVGGCDLIAQVFRAEGTYTHWHCAPLCHTEAGDTIEGIGGCYPDGTTFSYLSDDIDLVHRINVTLAEIEEKKKEEG